MTTSQGPWPGRFVWHDLMTTDAKTSHAYYAALFDWQVEEQDMMGHTYRKITAGPGPIGGIIEEKNIPMSHWMPYVAVDNVDETAARITEHGGQVCVPPTDIPATGRFAVVGDPLGAFFSIYTGNAESSGFDPDVPVPGRVCWNELWTADPDKAMAFYGAIFGWKDDPTDMGEMGTYHVQMHGDKQAAGLMKPPADAPSCWCVYFLVEDLEQGAKKAQDLGGKMIVPPTPIPNVGRFSLISDPVGAVFALFEGDAKPC